jgi:valyl-tRNA synthetase
MPHDLPKAYDPTAIEDHWAEYWVRENLFAQPTPEEPVASEASASPAGAPFTILLPPPNVTGRLHMGHMLNQTEMDILTRWRRMSGRRALWLPGTDHAGIATQMMVERQLTEEGTTRQQLGREAFVERVWAWKRHYGGAILSQMKRLGASVDWQREYFTMDDNLSVAVREAFVRLYEQGLIYRGAYIVNWCPRCQTAISDLEVIHQEQKGHLWEIRYSVVDEAGQDSGEFITVATTRPETMLGDTAIAIHPEDERYLHLHGKSVRVPLVGRVIPIILDTWVSRDFGTGAVKVTPAHDPNDFELGKRHNLPNINVMDETAHINSEGGVYAGLDRYVARKRIVADLEAQGLLASVRDHTNSVGHCDRCKTVVEPRLSTQWFVAVNKKTEERGASMAGLAIEAVQSGAIKFTPEMYKKTYLNWMENIYDWCISRQLWWGHRIPAWHCATCTKITVARVDPTACSHCGSKDITQETDVLDTWFSSGLLPVSVFGWPNFTASHQAQTPGTQSPGHPERAQRAEGPASFTPDVGAPGPSPLGTEETMPGAPSIPRTSAEWVGDHDSQPEPVKGTGFSPYINALTGKGASAPEGQNRADFNAFYPTSLLVTGFDILFYWVARMIMLGVWFAQDVPEADGSPRSLANSVPFKEVYIHALVRDANREKMSKTKGNVIDPIEIVKQYGTDAVRFTLASMASPGTDIAFNIARTEGYRAFANKIWNAARFIFQNVDRAREVGITVDRANIGSIPTSVSPSAQPGSTAPLDHNAASQTAGQTGFVTGHDFSRAATRPEIGRALAPAEFTSGAPLEARWIVAEFHATAGKVNEALENYRYDDAANLIYQFFWGSFCDWYLEIVKLRLDFSETADKAATKAALTTLVSVFEASLRLLSPFMPFITEEIWHALYGGNPPARSIALTEFPTTATTPIDTEVQKAMSTIQSIIVETRILRKEIGVEEKAFAPIQLRLDSEVRAITLENQEIIKRLAKVSDVRAVDQVSPGLSLRTRFSFDVAVIYERTIDVAAERDRLTKDIAKYEKGLASAQRQLGNEAFILKAPPAVVEGLKKQEAETRLLLEKARAALAALPEA